MKKHLLLVAWVLSLATATFAQTTITVPWNTDLRNINPQAWGINVPTFYDPARSTNTSFMADIQTLTSKKPLIRLWDISIYDTTWGWINSDGTWNATKIKQAVQNLKNAGYQVIITIPGPVDGDLSTAAKRTTFANFCASLVQIVNIDGACAVKYWEIGNEIEEDITATQFSDVINKASVAMKLKDNTIKVGGIATSWINNDYILDVVDGSLSNIDFVSAHMYPGPWGNGNNADVLGRYDDAQNEALKIADLKADLATLSPSKYIPIFIDEYNVATDDSELNFNNKGGVFDALFATNCVHNGADITNFWEMAGEDTWFSLIKPDYTMYPIANYVTLLNNFFYGQEAHSASSGNKSIIDMFAAKSTAGTTTTYALMLINRTASTQTVKLVYNGLSFTPSTLSEYKITSSGYTGPATVNWTGIKDGLSMPASSIFVYVLTYDTSTPPAAPTGLTATAGNTQISLAWTASSGASTYNVYRGTTAGGESTTPIATGITSTTYVNTGLTNGTTYYYKVKAVNSAGTSGYSNEASATPSGGGSLITVDDKTTGWTWSGWSQYNDPSCYGGTAHGNSTNNSYGQYTFTGTAVNVYAWKGPDGGSLKIYIDGTLQGTYSLVNAGGDIYNQLIFAKTGLSNASHTIKIQAGNTSWAMVDYITYQSGGSMMMLAAPAPATQANEVTLDEGETSFEVYPNPFVNKITVTIPKDAGPGVIEIRNQYGQTVHSIPFDESANGKALELRPEGVTTGTYVIRVKTSQGNYVRRIIKSDR